jgi:NADP-dependent 3-hydroxy acid dehydrogenase YdfG
VLNRNFESGLGFAKALVKRDNAIVFAGARDLTRVTELEALAKEFPGKLHIVKIVSADEATNKAVVEEIKAKVGRLDVVIANAGQIKRNKLVKNIRADNRYQGIARSKRTALETPTQDMREHFEVCFKQRMLLLASWKLKILIV